MAEKDVVVFGRTGAGKSTVANMLITGRLTNTPEFPIGDGMCGVTGTCLRKAGRSYSVVDTVGLQEATGSNREAKEQTRRYLKRTRGSFTHILFVRRGRNLGDDCDVWEAFLELFKGAEAAFAVCITGISNNNYVQENRRALLAQYPQCQGRFICIDFPPLDPELERRQLVAKRARCLEHFETKLAEIFQENGYRSFQPNLCKDPPARRQPGSQQRPRGPLQQQQLGLQQRPRGSLQQRPRGSLQQQQLGLQQRPRGSQQQLGLQQRPRGSQQQLGLQQRPRGSLQQQQLGLQQRPRGSLQQQQLGLQQRQRPVTTIHIHYYHYDYSSSSDYHTSSSDEDFVEILEVLQYLSF